MTSTVPATLTLRGRPSGVRHREPVSIGIPFPRGACRGIDSVGLQDGEESTVPCQWQVLSRWPDESVRWALLDFPASTGEGLVPEFRLVPLGASPATGASHLRVTDEGGHVRVDTGAATFLVSSGPLGLRAVMTGPVSLPMVWTTVRLTWPSGREVVPRVSGLEVEVAGPVRATVVARGSVSARRRTLRLTARLSFFAGTGLVRIELTVHNPGAARHPGGCWDLGDPGSVLLRDLSVATRLDGSVPTKASWMVEADTSVDAVEGSAVEVYQDTSGGENWRNRNHVNRLGQVPLTFQGYRVRWEDGERRGQGQGRRASPVVSLASGGLTVHGTVEQFWQNFPKAVEANRGGLRFRLFPTQSADLFELQGGEQKTHCLWLEVESSETRAPRLAWVHRPLVLAIDPAWVSASQAIPHLTPRIEDPGDDYEGLVRPGLEGSTSFFAKREVVDEHGWRHFGEVYADHENAHFAGPPPVVSHYNNQYDLVQGCLVAFLRSGDARWFELGRDLARHVMDIDVYRTQEDRPAYNGGLFWHTDHYQDAHRATHRGYSKDSPLARAGRAYGGGPSNEHNYTAGLLLYHYLTGCQMARETVLMLAEWVLDMDDGAKTPWGVIDPGPTGLASSTRSADYHGPGRGAGNSINALLDAFQLTGHRRYLAKTEELIRRCIHPRDDIAARGLGDAEERWSYLVFLQVLGRYLDVKLELDERDGEWVHARASLDAYARWMLDHEVPYVKVLDQVEYPTETWPAHDVRKAVVFGYAARYGLPPLRAAFRQAAESYFREALDGVSRFETRACTRPLAILLQNAWVHEGLRQSTEPEPAGPIDPPRLGEPVRFETQRARVRRLARSPGGLTFVGSRLARPDRLLRFVRLAALELRWRWP